MFDMTALELAGAIREKKLSVPDVVNTYIENIDKNDKQYNTFIKVIRDSVLRRAKEIQSRIENGETISPLAGVPVALKDNISKKAIETTCASKMLNNYNPVFDATVTEKLEDAGLIIIGKLNMDEFAMGGTEFYGAVRNPWDVKRAAGDGCAAAIAAGEVPLAIGTDTGGEIRKPCSYCGATGIKPTYGSVSRYGIVAYASSLDQAGTVGQNIEDCAALLSIISGPDNKDSTCIIEKPFNMTDMSKIDMPKGFKIGLPANYTMDENVKAAILAAAKEYEAAGAIIEEIEMPYIDIIDPVYCIITSAEASSNLAKFDGLKYGYRSANAKTLSEVYRLSRSEGFGMEVKRKIMLGSLFLSSGFYETHYKKALQARTLIRETYKKLFGQFDLILSPVSPSTASLIDSSYSDPKQADLFTAAVNLAGLPAAALPCGFDKQGLPIGFQLIGDTFCENKLINIARIYQNRTTHHKRKPGK